MAALKASGPGSPVGPPPESPPESPSVRPTVSPVRPPGPLLESVIHAAATPGLGGARIRSALTGIGELGLGDSSGPIDRLRELTAATERGLSPAERDRARGWARRALETIRAEGVHVLLPGRPGYPAALLRLHNPPCPLFARGRLALLDSTIIAVVGTRKATRYGRDAAARIAGGMAAAGVTIVSGLAAGIDGEAHRAAGPSRTIGVLGCGIDVVYPRAHRSLQRAIGREGLLLTEQLPGAPPARHNFPLRNRIISELGRAVVVIEAPDKSGALNTARQALEAGRDVFSVPGAIDRETSYGSNRLIREGATLVTSAREILGALDLPLPPDGAEEEVPPTELEGQGLALWRVLGREPLHVDEISTTVGLDPHRSLASLLALEVRGHARQLPGMRFVRSREPNGAPVPG